MIKCIVKITASNINELEVIGRSGILSSGYDQDFQFCLSKAIEEFIKKYKKR